MKQLSYWAKHNPRKAQLSIAGLYILLNTTAWLIGKLMYDLSVFFSSAVLNSAILLFLIAAILYKRKANYYYRKGLDLTLSLTTFVMICCISNQYTQGEFRFPFTTKVAHAVTLRPGIENGEGQSINPKQKQLNKKEIRKELRKQLGKQKKGLPIWAKILLIAAIAAVGLFAAYLLAILSCNLSCSGAEAFAVVVLVFGVVGVILGSYFLIRTIVRSPTKSPTSLAEPSEARPVQ